MAFAVRGFRMVWDPDAECDIAGRVGSLGVDRVAVSHIGIPDRVVAAGKSQIA